MYATLLLVGLSAGLYVPSGLTTITSIVSQRHWGKALGIHELAPSLTFILAPIVSEILMKWFSWRAVVAAVGLFSLLVGGSFMRFGKGGDFHGQAPSVRVAGPILTSSAFWIMLYLFILAAGNTVGVYAMLPLYLVTEKGLERTFANSVIACAGLLNPFAALGAGWLNDRLGEKTAIFLCLATGGLVTTMLGIAPPSWIVAFVILHPAMSASFFAPGLSALSRVAPPSSRNVIISLTLPISNFLGRGTVSAGIGYLGETHSFALGILLMGVLVLSGLIFIPYITFPKGEEEGVIIMK
jgi:NNP family nitrate/nitrite transporter-like MFS transporter